MLGQEKYALKPAKWTPYGLIDCILFEDSLQIVEMQAIWKKVVKLGNNVSLWNIKEHYSQIVGPYFFEEPTVTGANYLHSQSLK